MLDADAWSSGGYDHVASGERDGNAPVVRVSSRGAECGIQGIGGLILSRVRVQ